MLTVNKAKFNNFEDTAVWTNSYFWAITIIETTFDQGKKE